MEGATCHGEGNEMASGLFRLDKDSRAGAAQGYILVVGSEPDFLETIKDMLERGGFTVRAASAKSEAARAIRAAPPGVVVIDIVPPVEPRLAFVSEIRRISTVPIIALSASDMPQDAIRAFQAGADDYLIRPVMPSVFMARIRALMRRSTLIPDILDIGPIRINMAASKAYLNGEDMILQQKELSILQQFAQFPNQNISAELLYEKVWGQEMLGQDNALKVAISKLRTKLAGSGYTIASVRGEGYCFKIEDDED